VPTQLIPVMNRFHRRRWRASARPYRSCPVRRRGPGKRAARESGTAPRSDPTRALVLPGPDRGRARPAHRRGRLAPRVSTRRLQVRYLQLTRFDHLSFDQLARPEVLGQDPDLYHAWKLLQTLYDVYEAEDEEGARERIEAFVHRRARYPVPESKTVLKVRAQWSPETLAFHRCERITNGRLEGQNNKLGVLKRIAYGFVNADNFAALGMKEVAIAA
jgi:hypothetical protein